MPNTSRRNLLAVFATSAASASLGGFAAAPARAATTAATVTATESLLTAPRSSVTLPALDASYFIPVALGPLTASVLSGTPERTEVTSGGKRVAVLTKGARTVVLHRI